MTTMIRLEKTTQAEIDWAREIEAQKIDWLIRCEFNLDHDWPPNRDIIEAARDEVERAGNLVDFLERTYAEENPELPLTI